MKQKPKAGLVAVMVATILFFGGLASSSAFEGTEETARVFPTYASILDDELVLPIHVWVFEPEKDLMRRAAVAAFAESLDLEDGTSEHRLFHERSLDFMVDNESGVEIFAKVEGVGIETKEYRIGETPGNGHVDTVLTVPFELAKKSAEKKSKSPKKSDEKEPKRPSSIELTLRFDGADIPLRTMTVPVVPATGQTVISDIDDTIKITNVVDREELLANTFTREFRAVPGMEKLYAKWAKNGVRFHYVSASPWNLHDELSEFATAAGFPHGVYHLRIFRLMDVERTVRFLRSSEGHKVRSITALFEQFPKRTFVLVGDTGEKDPEIYARFAREFPDQVEKIYLRRVEGAENQPARFEKAFDGIPKSKWNVFADPGEL